MEIKEREIKMPVMVLCTACKNCERLDITIQSNKMYADDEIVAIHNSLRCTYLNECKNYAELVKRIISENGEDDA